MKSTDQAELEMLRDYYHYSDYAMGPASGDIQRNIIDRWIKGNPGRQLPERYLPERYDEEDDGA